MVGGGVADAGELLLGPLREEIRRRACVAPVDRIAVSRLSSARTRAPSAPRCGPPRRRCRRLRRDEFRGRGRARGRPGRGRRCDGRGRPRRGRGRGGRGRGGLAVPGFVDVQVNGFAGVDFLAAEPADYARAGDALAARRDRLPADAGSARRPMPCGRALAAVAAGAERSPGARARRAPRGAVPVPALAGRAPAPAPARAGSSAGRELLAAGPVAAMTLAPELPGALELIEALAARGVNVRIGHTDADAWRPRARPSTAARRAITHIHNAHRPLRRARPRARPARRSRARDVDRGPPSSTACTSPTRP